MNKFGQGRMLFAKDALAAGLVDRVATLEEIVGKLIGDTTESDKRKAQANAARARQIVRQAREVK